MSVSSNDIHIDSSIEYSESDISSLSFDTSNIETLILQHNADFNEYKNLMIATISENSVSGNSIVITPSDSMSNTLSEIKENQESLEVTIVGIGVTSMLIFICVIFDIMQRSARRIIGNMMSKPDGRE